MDNQVQSLEDDYDPADYSHTSNPEQIVIQQDRVQLVHRLISQLPERLRSCMQLRDIEGKSYRDIAEVLGISEQQVKVNIFRARQSVRERFQKATSEKTKKSSRIM
jgi:RNA polymerase sigma-70 factor (ECF subfamily)